MNKNLIAGVVIVGAVLLSSFLFKPEVNVTVNPDQTLGAVSSPDIQSPYFSFGGVRHWAGTAELRSASTTCAIAGPAATSTLVSATAQIIANSVPAASQWVLANAATAYASTTLLASLTLAANVPAELIATTSVTSLTNTVVPPNSYINFKIATGTATYSGWAPLGKCSAVFREM